MAIRWLRRDAGAVSGEPKAPRSTAELPVRALALDAELAAMGANAARMIPVRDFVVTMLTTRLALDEILIEARCPALWPGRG